MIKPEGRGFNSHPGQSFPLSLCGPISICRANAHIVYGLKHQHFTSHSITLFSFDSVDRFSLRAQLYGIAPILSCLLLFITYLFVPWNEESIDTIKVIEAIVFFVLICLSSYWWRKKEVIIAREIYQLLQNLPLNNNDDTVTIIIITFFKSQWIYSTNWGGNKSNQRCSYHWANIAPTIALTLLLPLRYPCFHHCANLALTTALAILGEKKGEQAGGPAGNMDCTTVFCELTCLRCLLYVTRAKSSALFSGCSLLFSDYILRALHFWVLKQDPIQRGMLI